MDPLPEGGLPADQTIEGGAQLRITPAGFQKLTSIIPAVINDSLDGGFCIPENQVVDAGVAEAFLCGTNAGMCSPGCPVSVTLDSTNITANDQAMNIQLQFDVHADVRIDYEVFWVITGSCDADFDLNNGFMDIDVTFGIDPATGELTIEPASINAIDITGIGVSGNCGGLEAIVDAALSLFAGLLDSFVGDLLLDLIQPLINDLFQGLLPDPLGIEGTMDLGSMIGSVSPGTNATLEVRGVPGGFVELVGNGLTLGMILGLNADEDLDTRTEDLDSEPAYCVPPVPAPDFAGEPWSLPTSPRSTFILAAADEFRGAPDPAADLAVGLSETTLDLAGHHAFTSGALCLGLGSDLIPQLNLGLIGILVPSLAALGSEEGDDPLLLVTRPVKPIDFTVGEGTEESPALTIHLHEFEIDFYAFVFERYIRGFTVRMDMDIGINLEYTTTEEGAPAILPVLTGLDADSIGVTALNSEFLAETDDDLEATLPTVLNLALPLVSDSLTAFEIPDFAGFTLGDLQTARVQTSEDTFLAIFASLNASMALRQLAEVYPSLNEVFGPADIPPERAKTRARLREVNTPAPERIRAGLRGEADGQLPEVVIDVEPYDEMGRRLEWTWNINGGMWRSFTDQTPLVIRDPTLVWQSEYRIEVRARVAGDYRTLDNDPVVIPVTIDSVGPRILADRTHVADRKVVVPATDLVSADEAIQFAYGHPGDGEPATDWMSEGLELSEVARLSLNYQYLDVYARDALGNITQERVDVESILKFHGQTGEGGGCSCAASDTDAASLGGMGLLAALTLLLLLATGRRRRRGAALLGKLRRGLPSIALYIGLAIGTSAFPACDCGGVDGTSCDVHADCDDACESADQCRALYGFCLENTCICLDDVQCGRIGQYSDLALSSGGAAWVSAYNSTHGDLNVIRWEGAGAIPGESWEYIDGVPEGPIAVEDSPIRNGVEAPGEDVGKYTSIAVNPLDEAMVSYFDQENVSLKFAANFGGTWQKHTVDSGTPITGADTPFEIVGQYSSMSTAADGRPEIAYFAHISEGDGVAHTEVRFASATTPTPQGPADWNLYIVDENVLPPSEEPDPLNIPPGVGLFIDSARQLDDTAVLVYYDRLNGDLKMARFDGAANTFMPPEILAGDDGTDVGWYPSVAVDESNNIHVSYVSATNDDLMYINTIDYAPELVDDGYRIVGTTEDGLPKPEFHLVGDDSSLVWTNVGPVIVYQDATVHELLMSRQNGDGFWEFTAIAGNEQEFSGGFGFYAAAEFDGQDIVVSSWVVDPPQDRVWVEIFRERVVVE